MKEATSEDLATVQSLCPEDVYQENIAFWERAWNMVRTPYTQLPSLSYIARIPDQLNKLGARRVLDLGCGSGWLSVYLARQGFEVLGIDVSEQAINLAKTWALQEDLKIGFDVGDAASLPYENESFDAVVANSIFEHFTLEQARALSQKVFKMLKSNGVFIGCFDKVGGGPGEYYSLADGTHVYTDKARKGMLLRCYSQEELAELFAGFATMSAEEVDAGSTFVVASKENS